MKNRNLLSAFYFSLCLFLSACNDKNDNDKNDYAETTATYVFDELENGDWQFDIRFLADESTDESMRHEIQMYLVISPQNRKTIKGYHPGYKPLKEQKIKIKYLKDEPMFIKQLEDHKFQKART